MKKFLLLLLVCFLITEVYSQSLNKCKNRGYDIVMDETIDGIWAGPDSTESVADSIYLYNTGIPDFGDLHVPDLELKMKSLWFDTKVYFLFRHLDDSLVSGYINNAPDTSLKAGLKNRDATALYFFLDTSDVRLDLDATIYEDSSYVESIAWLRWVWGSDDFEGVLKGDTINSISDLEVEIIQWSDDKYNYTKLSIDLGFLSELYNILDYKKLGFDIELNENDKAKELMLPDGSFGMQTRAFWGSDMDSAALAPHNISNWNWLEFVPGDSCTICGEDPSLLRDFTINFARVYPNPASEYVKVQFETYDEVEFRMYDLMGRLVKTGTLAGSEELIQLSDIKTGSYYLQLINQKGNLMTNKILILR